MELLTWFMWNPSFKWDQEGKISLRLLLPCESLPALTHWQAFMAFLASQRNRTVITTTNGQHNLCIHSLFLLYLMRDSLLLAPTWITNDLLFLPHTTITICFSVLALNHRLTVAYHTFSFYSINCDFWWKISKNLSASLALEHFLHLAFFYCKFPTLPLPDPSSTLKAPTSSGKRMDLIEKFMFIHIFADILQNNVLEINF
jgi:hypothetical protein